MILDHSDRLWQVKEVPPGEEPSEPIKWIVVSSSGRPNELLACLRRLDSLGVPIIATVREPFDMRDYPELRELKNVHAIWHVEPDERVRPLFQTEEGAALNADIGNLPWNRNFAQLLFGRVLMVDEDVYGITPELLRRMAYALDRALFAGARTLGLPEYVDVAGPNFLDNSRISRNAADAGEPQGTMIGGLCLAVDTRRPMALYSEDYGDDWDAMLWTWMLAEKTGWDPQYWGTARVPFADCGVTHQSGISSNGDGPDRARRQEKGEIRCEGMFAILSDPTLTYRDLWNEDAWRAFLHKRAEFLDRIEAKWQAVADRNDDRHEDALGRVLEIQAAREVLSQTTAAEMVATMERLRENNYEWFEHKQAYFAPDRNTDFPLFTIQTHWLTPPMPRRATDSFYFNSGVKFQRGIWGARSRQVDSVLDTDPVVALLRLLRTPGFTMYNDALLAQWADELEAMQSAPAPLIPADEELVSAVELACERAGLSPEATRGVSRLAQDSTSQAVIVGAINHLVAECVPGHGDIRPEDARAANLTHRELDLLNRRQAAATKANRHVEITEVLGPDAHKLGAAIAASHQATNAAEKMLGPTEIDGNTLTTAILRHIISLAGEPHTVNQARVDALREVAVCDPYSAFATTFMSVIADPLANKAHLFATAPAVTHEATKQTSPGCKRVVVIIPTFGECANVERIMNSCLHRSGARFDINPWSEAESQSPQSEGFLDIQFLVVDHLGDVGGARYESEDQRAEVIRTVDPVNVHTAVQYGMSEALQRWPDLSWVMVIQADVTLRTPRAVERLIAIAQAHADSDVQLAGPVMRRGQDWQHQTPEYSTEPTWSGPFIDDACYAISRKLMLAIRGLRTALFGKWGPDMMAGKLARDLGMGVLIAKDVEIDHEKGVVHSQVDSDYEQKETDQLIANMVELYGVGWVLDVLGGLIPLDPRLCGPGQRVEPSIQRRTRMHDHYDTGHPSDFSTLR